MALLDVSAAAKYGLSAAWADRLFNGQTKMGKWPVYYTDTCASRDTWGKCQSRPATTDIDVHLTSDSVIQGSGLEVRGGDWFANKPDTNTKFWQIVSNANASNPMWVTGPLRKGAGQWDGPTQPSGNWPGSFQGVKTYLDSSDFSPGKIELVNTGNNSINAGQIVQNIKGEWADRAGASVTFQFVPKGNPEFELSYSTANKISITTTNGIRTSEGSTNEATFQVTDSLKTSAVAGIKDVAQVGIDNTLTISRGWKDAWSTNKEVNFSKASMETKENTTTARVKINLNGLEKNGDGSYGYQSPAPIVNGVTSNVPKKTVTFWPSQTYRAVISYDEAKVQNVLTGNWEVKGNIGSIRDDRNNIVSMTAASALAYADGRHGAEVLNYSPGSLGSLNATGTGIRINGESMATTTVAYNFDVSYYNPDIPRATESSRGNREYDLSTLDNQSSHDHSSHDAIGYYLALETKEDERAVVIGSGHEDSIKASLDGNHSFINSRSSILTGNDNRDRFIFDRVSEGNNIASKSGNDIVQASSYQNADLGGGHDTYVIKGGYGHNINTGPGKDTITVTNAESSFSISDFDLMNDRIIAGGRLRNSEIRFEIDNPDQLPNSINSIIGATITVFLQDNQIGTVSIDPSAAWRAALNSPNKFLESAEELLKTGASWMT